MVLADIRPTADCLDDDFEDLVIDENSDWLSHRDHYTQDELLKMVNFILNQKKEMNDNDDYDKHIPVVTLNDLNHMQSFAYKLIQFFYESQKQLLLIILGAGGTGKSFTIFAISGYLKEALKRCAPTGKAAFLIKGETLHSTFNIDTRFTNGDYRELTGSKLMALQELFKGTIAVYT